MKVNPINNFQIQNQIQNNKTNNEMESFKDKLNAVRQSQDETKLQKVCQDFESIFVNMLMKNMRSTVSEGGFIEKSHAREMFEGMLDEEISKEISKGQGIGLAKMMQEQLSKNINTDPEKE